MKKWNEPSAGIVMPGLRPASRATDSGQGRVGAGPDRCEGVNRLQHPVDKSPLHCRSFRIDVITDIAPCFPVPLAMASSGIQPWKSCAAFCRSGRPGCRNCLDVCPGGHRATRRGTHCEGASEIPISGAAMARAQVHGFQGKNLVLTACLLRKTLCRIRRGRRWARLRRVLHAEVLMRNIYLRPFHAAAGR
jgi:hypothetical protein